jgi:hypothetical protein
VEWVEYEARPGAVVLKFRPQPFSDAV